MKLVTVYVVCNNHEDFVATAVESVFAQTYSKLEVIVFDNGSSDQSRQELRRLSETFDFVLVEQDNIGLVATIDKAYRMASGEYVVRLDADDWLAPNAVEKLVSPLDRSPDVAISFPDYFEVASDGHILRRIRRRVFDESVTLLDQPAHGAVTLTRKSAFFAVGGIDPTITAQDGVDIWLKITSQFRVENVSEPLFYYRRHDGNLTGDSTRILRQRHEIFRRHSGSVDANLHLGVIVLPKMKNSEMFLSRRFGTKTLLGRAIGKFERSEHCRSAVIITVEDDAASVREHAQAAQIPCSVIVAAPHQNGFAVAREVAQETGKERRLVFVSPQNPFMHLSYIDTMIYYRAIFDVRSVHSCIVDNHLLFQHNGRSLTLFNDGLERSEREAIIRKCGGLMLVDAEAFAERGNGLCEPIGHIEIDEITAFEIGSPISIEAADVMAAAWG